MTMAFTILYDAFKFSKNKFPTPKSLDIICDLKNMHFYVQLNMGSLINLYHYNDKVGIINKYKKIYYDEDGFKIF